MIVDDISKILEKEIYSIDSDIISRIETMLESIRDDNEINKLEWKKNLRSSSEQDKINFQKQITTLENDRNNVNNKFKTSS